MERPFSVSKVKEVAWGCEGSRSLGPDGFNFTFIRKCWRFMERDFIRFFKDFHGNSLSKAIVSSFITLIPKKDILLGLNDYRPICLVGSLYKSIAKLFAARLKRVLGALISSSQSAFVLGRNLLDGVLVVNKVVDYVKKSKQSCFLLKSTSRRRTIV